MKYLSVILLARGSLVLRADFRNYLGPQNGGSRRVERLESGVWMQRKARNCVCGSSDWVCPAVGS